MYFYYTFLPCFCQYTISYYANYILCIQLWYNFRHIFTDISYLSDRLLSVPCSSYNPVTKSLFITSFWLTKSRKGLYLPGFGNLHQFRQDLQLICKAQPVSVSAHNEPLQLPQMQQEFLCSLWEGSCQTAVTCFVVQEILVRTITWLRCQCEWVLSFCFECRIEGDKFQ